MKTRAQLGKRFRVVTVDGKTFRVQRKTLWWWRFVWCGAFGIPTIREFSTKNEAQQHIEQWVENDYRAQPQAWKPV